jgi:hypothetical protein
MTFLFLKQVIQIKIQREAAKKIRPASLNILFLQMYLFSSFNLNIREKLPQSSRDPTLQRRKGERTILTGTAQSYVDGIPFHMIKGN